MQPEERLAIKNFASLLPIESLIESGLPKAAALAYLGTAAYSAYTEAERAKAEKERLTREAQDRQLLQLTQTQSTLDEIKDIQQRQALAIEGREGKIGQRGSLLEGEEEVTVVDEPPVDRYSAKKADIKAYVDYAAAKTDFNPTITLPDTPGKNILIDLDVPFTRRFVYDPAVASNRRKDLDAEILLEDIKRRGYDVALNSPDNRFNSAKDYFEPHLLLKKILNPYSYIPRIISSVLLPAHKKLITQPIVRPASKRGAEYGESMGGYDDKINEMYRNDYVRLAKKSGFIDPDVDPEEHVNSMIGKIHSTIQNYGNEDVDYYSY